MERWLPRGYRIAQGISAGKQLSAGRDWQLFSTNNQGFALAVSPFLYEKWAALDLLPPDLFRRTIAADREVWLTNDSHDSPICSVKYGPYPENYGDAMAFAAALKRSRGGLPGVTFENALYFEKHSLILPAYEDESLDDQTVLCRWIASGVEISLDRFDRLCEIASWMTPEALANVAREAGFSVSNAAVLAIEKEQTREKMAEKSVAGKQSRPAAEIGEHFSLPGRPALEAFFNEHIIEIIRHSEEYQRMGVSFPAAVILHGPPGCGKTFAVDRLIEFLGWPSFHIDSGSIGSPFIHDTSRKISEIFDRAIENAPSVIVIDEMEAFLSARDLSPGSGQHHAEEVAEFLRRIPEATSSNVLVIAMTNLIHTIDPAILRRGRFDHIIEVQMPSREEVESLLRHLFETLPVCDDIDYDGISSKLEGRAMSDVTYVVREAGRLAVRRNEDRISNSLLADAMELLPKKKQATRKIGF